MAHYKVKLPYYKKAAAGKLNKDDAKKEFDKHFKKHIVRYDSNPIFKLKWVV
jgi:hypothetical protein